MLLTTLPYLARAAATPDGRQFGGFVIGSEDGNSYLAKMRRGANSAWLFSLSYTAEPHAPAPLFLLHLALGKIGGAITPPSDPNHWRTLLLIYHAARLLFGFLALIITYRFAAAFIRPRPQRWIAFALIALGGGLGWLILIGGEAAFDRYQPLDMMTPEAFTYLTLYAFPHLALARAALFGGLLCLFRAAALPRQGAFRWALAAGLCWLIMAVLVSFYTGVIAAVLGGWGVLLWLRTRRLSLGLLWRCMVAGILPALWTLYSALSIARDPVLAGTLQAQNVLLSPPPLSLLWAYGILALCALPALALAWRRGGRDPRWLLPLAWVILTPFLAYAPLPIQRRLLEGVWASFVILGVIGLRLWWIALRRALKRRIRWAWRVGVTGIVVVSLLTPFLVMGLAAFGSAGAGGIDQLYHPDGLLAALYWLDSHAEAGAVVLASTRRVGNLLPAFADVRAYIGHGVETLNALAKEDAVSALYAGRLSEQERSALLASVDYWLFTPADPPPPDVGRVVYEAEGYVILTLRPR